LNNVICLKCFAENKFTGKHNIYCPKNLVQAYVGTKEVKKDFIKDLAVMMFGQPTEKKE